MGLFNKLDHNEVVEEKMEIEENENLLLQKNNEILEQLDITIEDSFLRGEKHARKIIIPKKTTRTTSGK